MRSFSSPRRFALIIVSCNSLAHLTSTDDLKACFACVRQHLTRDVLFAFDIVNPDVATLARSAIEVLRPEHSNGELTVHELSEYDALKQVWMARWVVRQAGRPVQKLAPLRLRQMFPQELRLLLETSGMSLIHRYGDFDGGYFTRDSLNQVCLAAAA